ncbi:hypothetical protein P154DRAFT_572532 [Amniculicola lignicola CBS 123094]|uniref:DUF7702 domain-containing protein n=1 Tax=Amniculicola lignicola CBS 123094 TaxID=1392246 RepID=A0A6A5WQD0_9PLEO|nr:hypothetical protein P154DRAFT_572532 [Amniculicola lignicola CBS 123094]
MPSALLVATAIIYAILIQPISYCTWKHGKPGLLGFMVVLTFCVIRIVGSVLQIGDEKSGTTTTATLVIANIGLSPMILGVAGILHEARTIRDPTINIKIEWAKLLKTVVLSLPYVLLRTLYSVIVTFSPNTNFKNNTAAKDEEYPGEKEDRRSGTRDSCDTPRISVIGYVLEAIDTTAELNMGKAEGDICKVQEVRDSGAIFQMLYMSVNAQHFVVKYFVKFSRQSSPEFEDADPLRGDVLSGAQPLPAQPSFFNNTPRRMQIALGAAL